MDTFPHAPLKNYQALRHEIRSGDILLCSGNSVFSSMIQQATNSCWSHVGFILRLDEIDRIMVLESVESIGVRAVTLRSYVSDYNGTGRAYPGTLLIARHHAMKQENIRNLSKIAVDLLGHPYHTQEILNIAARISMGLVGVNHLDKKPRPEREFICSEYAYECFRSVGVTIDHDERGFIAPADFARSVWVSPISFIATEEIVQPTMPIKSKQALAEPA